MKWYYINNTLLQSPKNEVSLCDMFSNMCIIAFLISILSPTFPKSKYLFHDSKIDIYIQQFFPCSIC